MYFIWPEVEERVRDMDRPVGRRENGRGRDVITERERGEGGGGESER